MSVVPLEPTEEEKVVFRMFIKDAVDRQHFMLVEGLKQGKLEPESLQAVHDAHTAALYVAGQIVEAGHHPNNVLVALAAVSGWIGARWSISQDKNVNTTAAHVFAEATKRGIERQREVEGDPEKPKN